MTWESYAVTPGMMEEVRRFLRAPTKRVSCDIQQQPCPLIHKSDWPCVHCEPDVPRTGLAAKWAAAYARLAYGGEPPSPLADLPSDTEPPIREETELEFIRRRMREIPVEEGRA